MRLFALSFLYSLFLNVYSSTLSDFELLHLKSPLILEEQTHPSLYRTTTTAVYTMDQLQLLLSGIWEGTKLPAPMTVIQCFDQDLANSTLWTINGMIYAANAGKFDKIHKDLTQYMRAFPKEVLTCIKENKEVHELLDVVEVFRKSLEVRMSQLGVYVASNQKEISLDFKLGIVYLETNKFNLIGKTFVKVLLAAFQ